MSDSAEWQPSSWRSSKLILQQPDWPDERALRESMSALSSALPVVEIVEVRSLTSALGEAAAGKAIVLQAGDCAEAFVDDPGPTAVRLATTVESLAKELESAVSRRVVSIGRVAGQFAKPRTSAFDSIGGRQLPAFRGHIVNEPTASVEARTADPSRLLHAYEQSCRKAEALRSLDTACSLWTSHEALLLPYEEALVRFDQMTKQYYALSAHLLWVGERTRSLDSAHITFLAGISNPIGCKLGATAEPKAVVNIVNRLNPGGRAGRLLLITRMGAQGIARTLPPILDAVEEAGTSVTWLCDPMHGNTVTTRSGRRTRSVAAIKDEISEFCTIVRAAGAVVGGLHLELTAEPVAECADEIVDPFEHDAVGAFTSLMDPRLNAAQARSVVRHFSGCVADDEHAGQEATDVRGQA